MPCCLSAVSRRTVLKAGASLPLLRVSSGGHPLEPGARHRREPAGWFFLGHEQSAPTHCRSGLTSGRCGVRSSLSGCLPQDVGQKSFLGSTVCGARVLAAPRAAVRVAGTGPHDGASCLAPSPSTASTELIQPVEPLAPFCAQPPEFDSIGRQLLPWTEAGRNWPCLARPLATGNTWS